MTMATLERTVTAPVAARRDGVCPHCPEPIRKGDAIAKVDGTTRGFMHHLCAIEYARHLEGFDEINREIDEGAGGVQEEN